MCYMCYNQSMTHRIDMSRIESTEEHTGISSKHPKVPETLDEFERAGIFERAPEMVKGIVVQAGSMLKSVKNAALSFTHSFFIDYHSKAETVIEQCFLSPRTIYGQKRETMLQPGFVTELAEQLKQVPAHRFGDFLTHFQFLTKGRDGSASGLARLVKEFTKMGPEDKVLESVERAKRLTENREGPVDSLIELTQLLGRIAEQGNIKELETQVLNPDLVNKQGTVEEQISLINQFSRMDLGKVHLLIPKIADRMALGRSGNLRDLAKLFEQLNRVPLPRLGDLETHIDNVAKGRSGSLDDLNEVIHELLNTREDQRATAIQAVPLNKNLKEAAELLRRWHSPA